MNMNNSSWEEPPQEYENIPRKELLREWLLNAWANWKDFAMIAIVWSIFFWALATAHDRHMKGSLEKSIEVNGKVVLILDCDIPTRTIISDNFWELWYWIADVITWGKTCVPVTKIRIPIEVQEWASFGYAKDYRLSRENLPNPSFMKEVSAVIDVLKTKNFRVDSVNIYPKASPEWEHDSNIQLAESRWQYVLTEILNTYPELRGILKTMPATIGKLEASDIKGLTEIAIRNNLTNPDSLIQSFNKWTMLWNEADRIFVKKLLDRTTEININGKLDAIAWMRLMDGYVMLICITLLMCWLFWPVYVVGDVLETGVIGSSWAKRKTSKTE